MFTKVRSFHLHPRIRDLIVSDRYRFLVFDKLIQQTGFLIISSKFCSVLALCISHLTSFRSFWKACMNLSLGSSIVLRNKKLRLLFQVLIAFVFQVECFYNGVFRLKTVEKKLFSQRFLLLNYQCFHWSHVVFGPKWKKNQSIVFSGAVQISYVSLSITWIRTTRSIKQK